MKKFQLITKVGEMEIKKFDKKRFSYVTNLPFLCINGRIKFYTSAFNNMKDICEFLAQESKIKPHPDNRISISLVEQYRTMMATLLASISNN